jgi:hypothetical protein
MTVHAVFESAKESALPAAAVDATAKRAALKDAQVRSELPVIRRRFHADMVKPALSVCNRDKSKHGGTPQKRIFATLLRTLMAWARGERRVCSMVRPPSPEDEDRRCLTHERGTLLKEVGDDQDHG